MIQLQLRRGTAASWATINPVLADGEPGYERDTGKFKFGDGITNWNGRPYAALQGATGATGAAGPTGATGATGAGVPAAGTTGQALVKKSNDDYDTEWGTVASSGGGGEIRQTVLSSLLSSGLPAFISAGTGLSANIAATSVPLILSFANGFNTNGPDEKIEAIEADTTIGSLTASKTNYLYAERNAETGEVTLGKTILAPVYAYNLALEVPLDNYVLLNFDGTNGSQSFTDESGKSWSAMGNAQISTTGPKFGTGKLLLDGTGDGISCGSAMNFGQSFTVEGWFYVADKTINSQCVFEYNSDSYAAIALYFNIGGSNKFGIYLSSTGSTWNIASGTQGSRTSWENNTWYKFIVQFNGSAYKVYVGEAGSAMSEDISITSSSTIYYHSSIRMRFGIMYNSTSPLAGGMDNLRVVLGQALYASAPTPETAAVDIYDSLLSHYFSIPEMKMYARVAGAWVAKQLLFLGEAVTDGSGVTSVVNYALRGYYDSGPFAVAANTTYSKNHNLGVLPRILQTFASIYADMRTEHPQFDYHYSGTAILGFLDSALSRNSLSIVTATDYPIYEGSAQASGYYRRICRRGW